MILDLQLGDNTLYKGCTSGDGICDYECDVADMGDGTCNGDGTSCRCGEIKYLLCF